MEKEEGMTWYLVINVFPEIPGKSVLHEHLEAVRKFGKIDIFTCARSLKILVLVASMGVY